MVQELVEKVVNGEMTLRQALEEAKNYTPIDGEFDLMSQLMSKKVFIRTVTHHFTGRLVYFDKQMLKLSDAAWIADDGRFADALKTGNFSEVEPYPNEVYVGRGGIIDISEFLHDLPRVQK